jgi:glutathione S-transferase
MSDKIQFFYNPMSRARIAHWGLEESGLPYEITLLDLDKAEHKKPEYMKLNPMGKVPAIIHRGKVITEAAAILTYLGDLVPEKKLAPGLDDPDRGTYLRWMFFTSTNWESAVLEKNVPRTPALPSRALGFGSFDDTVHALEGAVHPGPFILGERFSMADVLLAAQLGYSIMVKWMEPRPAFKAYLERCEARPAAKRINEQGMEYIAKLKAAK